MECLSAWESFLVIKILNYTVYTPISTFTLGCCLFQVCLQNSTFLAPKDVLRPCGSKKLAKAAQRNLALTYRG